VGHDRLEERDLIITTELVGHLLNWPGATHAYQLTRRVYRSGKWHLEVEVGVVRMTAKGPPN
jgi:hypothetical protein